MDRATALTDEQRARVASRAVEQVAATLGTAPPERTTVPERDEYPKRIA